MAYLKFLDSKNLVKATVIPSGDNIVTIKFERGIVVDTSGFDLYLDEAGTVDIGEGHYHGFTTVYRNDEFTAKENGYQLSNDGSIYEEPVIPDPPEQTLEEVKKAKKSEIQSATQNTVVTGVEMDGVQFSYSQTDRTNLRTAYDDTAITGNGGFVEDANGSRVELTAEKVSSLYIAQEKNKIEAEERSTQLVKMVDAASDKDSVAGITYNTELAGNYLDSYTNRVNKAEKLLDDSALMKSAVSTQSRIMAVNNTDEQALSVKGLYANWEEDKDGYEYKMENPEDRRRNDNGKLWSLQKDHAKQANYRPGNDPTLWREIVEGHSGTIADPIPVPGSVTVSGFEYEYGKYYVENEVIYLCKRGGVENPEAMYGQKETLFFLPSQLIGQYFEVV